jgi:regulator of RNase E activity RraA
MTILTASELEVLEALDTPTVANVIETFNLRLRNEGYTDGSLHCRFPKLQSMVGYAVTMQMRTTKPPVKGLSYPNRSDWWEILLSMPNPKILVIEDTDHIAGQGSVAGGVHGSIFKALGCVGIVTNGAVRDLPTLEALKLHIYSGSITPSHAYAHIIDVGVPVSIGGTIINHGDLLHGDMHGLVNVPKTIASAIPQAAIKAINHEREIEHFCASDSFSVEKLRRMIETF